MVLQKKMDDAALQSQNGAVVESCSLIVFQTRATLNLQPQPYYLIDRNLNYGLVALTADRAMDDIFLTNLSESTSACLRALTHKSQAYTMTSQAYTMTLWAESLPDVSFLIQTLACS